MQSHLELALGSLLALLEIGFEGALDAALAQKFEALDGGQRGHWLGHMRLVGYFLGHRSEHFLGRPLGHKWGISQG